jgi:hypothetical protein
VSVSQAGVATGLRRGTGSLDQDTEHAGRSDVDGGSGATGPDLLADPDRIVDRDGQAGTRGGRGARSRCACGVDADDLSGRVDQRTPGIARLDVGGDLDQAGEALNAAGELIADRNRLIEGRNRARCDARRTTAAPGVADRRDVSPIETVPESPIVAVGKPEAPCIWSTARS